MTTFRSSTGSLTAYPERARRFLGELYQAYGAKQGLFARIDRSQAPQTRLRPEGLAVGSLAHLRWLFFAAMTDRRDLSENVYDGHRRLWQQAPWLYEQRLPEGLFMEGMQRELESFLVQERISLPRASARNWVACSRTLHGRFNGDPRRLFGRKTINRLVQEKESGRLDLPGFGPKILSLLALFLEELGIPMPRDAFPIDVHVQRFALATGILEAEGTVRNPELERVLRPLFARLARQEGWPVIELAHALWFLGSQNCTSCSLRSSVQLDCPVYAGCQGPNPSRPYFKKGLWDMGLPSYPKGCLRMPRSSLSWRPMSIDVGRFSITRSIYLVY